MNVQLADVASLIPYARNSRKHEPWQIDMIAASIKEYGWTNPVLIADDGIIAGHGRIMAAQKLGLVRVPAIDLSHLSEAQRRAYVIMDNRSAEKGTSWDLEMLKIETEDLIAEGFDINLTGFSQDELTEIFGITGVPSEADPDDAPGVLPDPISAPGDVWVLGAHKVMCGSSLEIDAWDRLMGGELIDCVWTDPPYNVDIGAKNASLDRADKGNRGKTGAIMNDKMDDAAFYQFLLDMYAALFTVMKPGAPIYVAHADVEGANFRKAFTDAGFKLQNCLVWNKNIHVLGRSDYQPKHEPILYGWKPGSKHRWYGGRKLTTVLEHGEGGPISRLDDGRWAVKVGDDVLVVDGDAKLEQHPGSVLYEPKPVKSGLHPTMKPVALVERMLKASARSGDIVGDAFGGSGTTLIAADRLGMAARLMELDPRYVDVIVRRWEQYSGRRAVHAETGAEFPAEAPAAAPAT